MHRSHIVAIFPAIALMLSACAGKTALQQPAQDLYNAASALASTEPKLLKDVNDTGAALRRIEQQNNYIRYQNFTLDAGAPVVNDAATKARIDAVNAVQIYAQAILTMTGSTPDQNIDTYSEKLAKDLQTEAKNKKDQEIWPGLPANQAQGIGAAISVVMQIVIDHKAYTTVKDVAKAAQSDFETLGKLIASDAGLLGDDLQSRVKTTATAREEVLDAIRSDKRIRLDELLNEFNSFAADNSLGAALSELANTSALAQQLIKANAALATGDSPSFASFAQEAYRRGLDAYNVYQNSKK